MAPVFLEKKLKKEYGNDKHAIYGTMNKVGAMHGNKETAKGKRMEKKHESHEKALRHAMGKVGTKKFRREQDEKAELRGE